MDLAVQKRETFGKKVKHLRDKGLIPAELYGYGVENAHISVPQKEFDKVYNEAGESSIINLVLDSKKHPVLIYDLQRDPVTDEVLSVDFNQVRMDKKVQIWVPLNFVGESEGVKSGGILVKAMQELEVEALPTNIPQEIEVDISVLTDIDQSIYVKDLKIPADVEALVGPDTAVASVSAPITEEEEAAQAAEADVSAVKVEGEEKKAEAEEGAEEKAEEKTAEKNEKSSK